MIKEKNSVRGEPVEPFLSPFDKAQGERNKMEFEE